MVSTSDHLVLISGYFCRNVGILYASAHSVYVDNVANPS